MRKPGKTKKTIQVHSPRGTNGLHRTICIGIGVCTVFGYGFWVGRNWQAVWAHLEEKWGSDQKGDLNATSSNIARTEKGWPRKHLNSVDFDTSGKRDFLIGTLRRDNGRSAALFKLGNEISVVREGELIRDGLVLAKVESDHVILSSDGLVEEIAVITDEQDASLPGTIDRLDRKKGTGYVNMSRIGANHWTVDYRNLLEMGENRFRWSDIIEIERHATDGIPDGLLIKSVKEGSIFQDGGLNAGDILLKIGDIAIYDEKDVKKAYESVSYGDMVVLDINRGGKIIKNIYSFL